jgi:hypothetical protein
MLRVQLSHFKIMYGDGEVINFYLYDSWGFVVLGVVDIIPVTARRETSIVINPVTVVEISIALFRKICV